MTDQEVYKQALANGCSPKLAEMFALQSPPGGMTDAVFLEGHCNGNQFEKQPGQGNYIKSVAEAHGQMTKGKVYLGGLARFPGDPEAWVEGRGDVRRLCEKRGWGCEGAVNIEAQGVERRPARKVKKGRLAKKLHEAGIPLAESVPTDVSI